jgi:hypothetical protein
MQKCFWALLGLESVAVGWIGMDAVRAVNAGLDRTGDARILLSLAMAMFVLLGLSAAVYKWNADSLVRRIALGVLVVPPVVRILI